MGYRCPFCGKEYQYLSHMMRHVRMIHFSSDDGGYVCPVCGRRFPTLAALAAHARWKKDEMHRVVWALASSNPLNRRQRRAILEAYRVR